MKITKAQKLVAIFVMAGFFLLAGCQSKTSVIGKWQAATRNPDVEYIEFYDNGVALLYEMGDQGKTGMAHYELDEKKRVGKFMVAGQKMTLALMDENTLAISEPNEGDAYVFKRQKSQ